MEDFNLKHSKNPVKAFRRLRKIEEKELEKFDLDVEIQRSRRVDRIEHLKLTEDTILETLEKEQIESANNKTLESLKSTVRYLNNVLSIENFYRYYSDEKLKSSLPSFAPKLKIWGTTLEECLEVLDGVVPKLVEEGCIKLISKDGGSFYKAKIVSLIGVGE